MKNFDPSNIRILDVRTIRFSAESPQVKGKIMSREDLKSFDYKVGYLCGVNEEEEIVRIVLEVEILGQAKGLRKARKLGKITTESFFYLLDFEDWVSRSTEEPRIHLEDFMVSILLGLAFSTTRGILLTRGAGTILEDTILPVIAPAKLMEMNSAEKP